MIIQEAVVGDAFDIEVCGDLEGKPVAMCTWKKYQSRLGETEQTETFQDEETSAFALRLASLISARGPVDIDVFRTEHGFVVLEFNTRFGGGYPVSQLAGANFPRHLVNLIRTGETEPDLGFQSGVIMMKDLTIIGGPADEVFERLGVER